MVSFVDSWNLAADVWWTWIASAFWQSAIIGLILLTLLAFARRWSSPVRYGLLLIALLKFAVPPLWSTPTGLLSHIVPAQQSSQTVDAENIADASTPLANRQPVVSFDELDAPLTEPVTTSNMIENDLDLPPDDSDPHKLPQDTLAPLVVGRIASVGPDEPTAAAAPDLLSEIATMPTWKAWLLLLHGAGALVVLLLITKQIFWLRRVMASSHPAKQAIQQATRKLEQQLGFRRQVRVIQSELVDSPMAFGLITPTIVLPIEANEYSARDLQTVLGHELAHLRQGDGWINWLQLVLMIVWWIHPVFWLVQRSVRRVSEDCCDDLLIAAGLTTQTDYCETLLRIADRPAASMMPIACSMAGRLHPLGERIKRIMDSGVHRTVRLSLLHLAGIIVVAVLLLPGLRIQLAQAQDEKIAAQAADDSSQTSSDSSDGLAVSVGSSQASQPAEIRTETKRNAPTDVPLPVEKFPSFANFPPSGTGTRVQLDGRRWVEFNALATITKTDDSDQLIYWKPNGELINPPDDFDPLTLVPDEDSGGSMGVDRQVLVQVVGPTQLRASMSSSGSGGWGVFSEPVDNEFVQLPLNSSMGGIQTNHAYVEIKVTQENWEELPLETASEIQIVNNPTNSVVYILVKNAADFAWKLEYQREGEDPATTAPSMVSKSEFSTSFSFPKELQESVRENMRSSGGLAFFFEKDKPRPKLTRLQRSRYDVVRFDNLSVYPGPKSAVRISLNGAPVSEETSPETAQVSDKDRANANDTIAAAVAEDSPKDEPSVEFEFIELSGKVVDGEGKPVPNCWVGMFTEPQVFDEGKSRTSAFDEGLEFSYEAQTEADGSFSILAQKTHFVFEGSFWAVRPDGSVGNLRLNCVWSRLQKNLTIKIADSKGQVRIVDENNSPVANAQVVLEAVQKRRSVTHRLPPEVQKRQQLTTDANGLVTFRGWPSGGIRGVAVTTDRYGTQVLNSRLSSQWVTGDKPLTLQLLTTSRLSGQVAGFDPKQHRGLQLEIQTTQYGGRPPLNGRARVEINDDGRFDVPAIAAGRLTFSSSLPPTSSTKIRFPRVPALEAEDDRVLKKNPQLEPAVVVRQRIIKSDTGEGIPDMDLRVLWGHAIEGDGSWRDSMPTKTDADGWWTAKVLPGKINVRISSGVTGYQGTAWFDGRSGHLGVEALIPATDSVVTLPPEQYVPSKKITGKLLYADGSPAARWSAYGHPISWNDVGVGGVNTDEDGDFTWTYPIGYPPRLYKVSNREWMTDHNFNDRYVIPKLVSEDPFVLQIPEKPPSKD